MTTTARIRSHCPHLQILAAAFLVALLSSHSAAAAPNDDEQVRAYVDKGKAAFGLGKFGEAAEAYESAFAIKPAAALLYNAAQAHRMAGHKERAVELYQSYLRLYRTGPNRLESEQHVANLQKALADEKRVATAPPNDMAADNDPDPPRQAAPVPTAPAAATAAPAPAPRSNDATTLTAPAERDDGSLTSSPWFWVGVGGVAVVATVVVLALTLGGSSDGEPREQIMGN